MPPDRSPRWHPMQSAGEPDPGHWELRDQYGNKYADIRLVRRDGELAYRCLVLNPRATAPADIGLVSTLREAIERTHRHWVSGHAGSTELTEDDVRAARFRMLPPGAPGSTRRTRN
jgi:hypothetical protein